MTAAAKIINLDPAHDSFSQRLQEITDKSSARHPINLTLDTPCKPTQLHALATGAINMPEVALSKLSLKVNCNLLSDAKFNDFLKTLQNNPPKVLALSLDESELQIPVLHESLEYIASIANFPIVIVNAQTQERVSFKAFEKKIIATIQSSKSRTSNSFTSASANEIIETAPQGPKIRLKALIKKQSQDLKKYTPFIQVQVEHTEIVEQKVEQVVNVNTEEVTD